MNEKSGASANSSAAVQIDGGELSSLSAEILEQFTESFEVSTPELRAYCFQDWQLQMLHAVDAERDPAAIYATLNLTDGKNAETGKPLMFNIWGASTEKDDGFDEIIAALAHEIFAEGIDIEVGDVMQSFLASHRQITPNLPHVAFGAPEEFEDLNYFFAADDLYFSFQVIPISDAEEEFLRRTSWMFLRELFASQGVVINDLQRASIDAEFLDAEATRINLLKRAGKL